MPDLTPITGRWCESNERGQVRIKSLRSGKTHSVHFDQYGYSCTCLGFRFRHDCRHIHEAEKLRCRYGWEAACGSPVEMGAVCPRCGGPTVAVKVMV